MSTSDENPQTVFGRSSMSAGLPFVNHPSKSVLRSSPLGWLIYETDLVLVGSKRRIRMRFQGAVIKEQAVTFAVVVVKKHIIDNKLEAKRAIQSFQTVFPGMPILLMAQDARGVPTYYGRRDIVKFMAKVPLEAVPWKEYSIA